MADPADQAPDDDLGPPGYEPDDTPPPDDDLPPDDAPPDDDAPPPDDDLPPDDAPPEPDADPVAAAAAAKKAAARDRIQRQQRENERLRSETAALKARLDAQEQSQRQAQQAEAQRRNAEMLAGLEPDERARVIAQQQFQSLQQQINQQRLDLQENADRSAWASKVASDPLAKRYEARVEQRLAEMRSQGQTAPRENIYKFLVGDDIATKGPKAVLQARTAAQRRTSAASGAAPRSRGDVQPASGRSRVDPDSIEALEARLKNARF